MIMTILLLEAWALIISLLNLAYPDVRLPNKSCRDFLSKNVLDMLPSMNLKP